MYAISKNGLFIEYMPDKCIFEIKTSSSSWKWGAEPYIQLSDGTKMLFSEASDCKAEYYSTGVADGVRAVYRGFKPAENIAAYTFMWLNPDTSELNFEIRIDGDTNLQISKLAYPAPFEFGALQGDGYTVLPRMQGTIVPAGTHISIADGRIQERDGYMSFFGQVRGKSGYIAIFDTPYDAHYSLPDDMVEPYFIESLGTIRYKRRIMYKFIDNGCDYVKIAKAYRKYMIYKGLFVSLDEKIARNPNIARLIGTPIVHEGIATHINKGSNYYSKDDPSKNDYYTPFSEREKQLRLLKENGLKRAYLHLDGWGNHGYDNLHPDPFPPHEASGGADGMRSLSEACREIGYTFGIHDQYRDYYYDAPSFSFDNAITNPDGTHPYCSVWYGGPHSWLCASLAPYYVRRNYDEFERLGITIEGSYLDVFSVVGLDECVSPDHVMSREQCVSARRECLDILTAKGIIPSSEETIDCIVPSLALCHHSPYFTSNLGSPDADPVGIHVPLFNLVYHDAIVIPWFGLKGGKKGGWGIPKSDNGYIHAILNGGTVYCPITADTEIIDSIQPALKLHERVAKSEMISHEFIDGNIRRQRTVFSDGTAVEVDFDTDEYKIV